MLVEGWLNPGGGGFTDGVRHGSAASELFAFDVVLFEIFGRPKNQT